MTVIRTWRGASGYIYNPTNQGQWTGNFPVLPGHTLVRTLLTVQLWEFFNTPAFPPLPPAPVHVAYYQSVNTGSLSGIPTALSLDSDFVASGTPEWFADFGVTSAVQSDVTFHAHIALDVKSERKALVSNPSYGVSFANMNAVSGGLSRVRQCTMGFVMRTLWEHTI